MQTPVARPLAFRNVQAQRVRFNSSAPPPPQQSALSNQSNHTALILAAIAGLGVGGYLLLKPVSDVASTAHSALDAAKGTGDNLNETLSSLAKASLPPGVFAIYQSAMQKTGGLDGLLSSLKNDDFQKVLGEIKEHGGDDVKRIVEKVESALSSAKGDVSKLDWKKLASDLKGELPKDKQQLIDVFIGKIPDSADIEKLIAKAKDAAGDQLKAAEAAAGKVWKSVEEARKDGKGQADAFLAGLKQATPNDVDELVKQLKDVGKSAGLPTEEIEAWIKSKGGDKLDPEALGKQFEDKLRAALKFLPAEPEQIVKQVEQVSPSVAKLLQQALEQVKANK